MTACKKWPKLQLITKTLVIGFVSISFYAHFIWYIYALLDPTEVNVLITDNPTKSL